MGKKSVSVCSDLRILPIGQILSMYRLGSKVSLDYIKDFKYLYETPGTVRVSIDNDGEVCSVSISAEVPDLSAESAAKLDIYRQMRFVASYIDERGAMRIAGNLNNPLKFDYQEEGGNYRVILSGASLSMPGYLD